MDENVEADVEVGGTDQTFNLLLGREIQRAYGQPAQCVLTLPLLEGTDGREKMSKSLGNSIGIREPAQDIYGKTMSIPDELLSRWIDLLTPAEASIAEARKAGEAGGNPRDLKATLARALVDRFAGPGKGDEAEAYFDRVFRQHRAPEDLDAIEVAAAAADLISVLQVAGFANSGGEARRLIKQGGVRVDEERVDRLDARLEPGEHLIQAGKRRFAKVCVAG